jgi:putative alpha-1,2-mannosidase
MENGKKIVINGKGASLENKYIKSAMLNGKTLNNAWFRHKDLKDGATINFNMSATSSDWATKGAVPPSY